MNNEYIYETVVTTCRSDGSVHIVPLGVRYDGEMVVLAPFKPSTTLKNIIREKCAVINFTDDVRVFAGCLIGKTDWPTMQAVKIKGARLTNTLSHMEVELAEIQDDPLRPRLLCRQVHFESHQPFLGFNRAQNAVLEASILVSRLHMLPQEKVRDEISYLSIAIDKTAGSNEKEAWEWLMEKIESYYLSQSHS